MNGRALTPAQTSFQWAAGIFAAAAIVAALLFNSADAPPAAGELDRFVSPFNDDMARILREVWLEPGWNATRDVSPEATAFRAGSRSVGLDLAVAAQHHEMAGDYASDLSEQIRMHDAESRAGQLLVSFAASAYTESRDWRPRHREARAELLSRHGESPWFQLGVWIELARLAVRSSEYAFLNENSKRALGSIAEELRDDPAAENVTPLLDSILVSWPRLDRTRLESVLWRAGG